MDKINEAFSKISRADFIPTSIRARSNLDIPLPIGYGQTISQPLTVKRMLRWLDVQSGDKILDVGSGSGWTSALLSYITDPKGCVVAVERVPELMEFGKTNCKKYNIKNIRFKLAHKNSYGWFNESPYNRILVSASASVLPPELLDQLKISGKLVIPVKNDILEITKKSKNKFDTIIHQGYIFVPLI